MTQEEVYDFIGQLAIALYTSKIKISLNALNTILADNGAEYASNRGLAKGVATAYKRWKEKDPVIHHAIAFTYVDRNGELPWQ